MVLNNKNIDIIKCEDINTINSCKIKTLDLRGKKLSGFSIYNSKIETLLIDDTIENLIIGIVKINNLHIQYKDSSKILSSFNDTNSEIENLIIEFKNGHNIHFNRYIRKSFNGVFIKKTSILGDIYSYIIINDSFNDNNFNKKEKELIEISGKNLKIIDSFLYKNCKKIDLDKIHTLKELNNSFYIDNKQIEINSNLEYLYFSNNYFSEYIIRDGKPEIVIDGIYYDFEYIRMLNNYNKEYLTIASIDRLNKICDDNIKNNYNNKIKKLKMLGITSGNKAYTDEGYGCIINYNTIFMLANIIKINNKQNKLNNKAIELFGNLKLKDNKLISLLNYMSIYGCSDFEACGTNFSRKDLTIDNVEITQFMFEDSIGKLKCIIEINNIKVLLNTYTLENLFSHSSRVYMNYKIGDEIIDFNYYTYSKYCKEIKIFSDGVLMLENNKLLDLMYSRVIEFKIQKFDVRTVTNIIDLNGDF